MPFSKTDYLLLIAVLGAFAGLVQADLVETYAAQVSGGRLLRPLKMPKQQNDVVAIPQMINIPAGCFQMGSLETEEGHGPDEVLHRVCVKGFKLAKNETTVEEFEKFINDLARISRTLC
jgi:serine/threonine-protein kinase PpkA